MSQRRSLRSASVALVLIAFGAAAMAQLPWELAGSAKPTLAPLLKQVMPAVVNISVVAESRVAPNPLLDDPFFRRFFEAPEQPRSIPQQAVGSGVIIDAGAGYILTNHHVVANADEITVTLNDRRRFQAELVGSDEGTDIALLKIDAPRLTEIAIGDSDALEVGDFVVAIGNPFGLGQTVTSGIVSALGRSGLNIEGYEDFIQTDASINPGNSGGALINLDGELVGINTAIVAPAGGNVGIGFAVPAKMANQVRAQLLEYGEVRRGRLGVFIQDMTPDLAQALDLEIATGAVVTQVEPNSAAEHAGLQPGDLIVEFDGDAVDGTTDLRNKVALLPLGDTVELAYVRDGRRRTVAVTIGEASSSTVADSGTVERLSGADFRAFDATRPPFGRLEGVEVVGVEPGSRAERSGLRQGDLITAVNRTPVASVEALARVVAQNDGAIALNVVRDSARLFIVVQ